MEEIVLKKSLLSLVAILAVVALAGCGLAEKAVEKATEKAIGGIAEKVVEEATGISVDEKDGTVTIKGEGEDGQELTISGGGGKVLEGFPLPVYPGAEVNDTGSLTLGDHTSFTGDFTVKGKFDDVVEFYENAMKEKGVAEPTRLESGSNDYKSVMLMGQSETESGTISIEWSKSSDETQVLIMWGDKD
jgi:hypothetical protein